MPNSIVARIARDAGIPDLVERLAEELVPTDLQSLLLEVYERRTEASNAFAKILYENAAAGAQKQAASAGGGPSTPPPAGSPEEHAKEVIDAEYVDEDEKK